MGKPKTSSLRSIEERDLLISSHWRIPKFVVRKTFRRLKKCGLPTEDAVQICRIALVRAAELWDEKKETKFSTYAIRSCFHALASAYSRYNFIHVPSTGIPDHFLPWLRQSRNVRSLGDVDVAVSDRRSVRGNWGIREDLRKEDFLAQETLEHFVFHCSLLRDRDKDVIYQRFWEDKTLDQIGQKLKVTRERARQLVQKALERLRKFLPPSVPEAYFETSYA